MKFTLTLLTKNLKLYIHNIMLIFVKLTWIYVTWHFTMLMVMGMISLQFKGGSKICNTLELSNKSTKQRTKIANLVETKDEM
jgi:hypothetical protein